jgi:AcrR family transcriptional regulator
VADRIRLWPDERRRLILDAARRVVGQRGRSALTMRDVAEACEVRTSISLVKYYFPGGREGILRKLGKK